MSLETQITELIQEYKDRGESNLPEQILRAKAVVEITELIQRNIEVLKDIMYFDRSNGERAEILQKCMVRLEQRKINAVNNILKTNNNAKIQAERFYTSIS